MTNRLSTSAGRRYRQFCDAMAGSLGKPLESVGNAPAPIVVPGNRRYYWDIRRRRLLGVR